MPKPENTEQSDLAVPDPKALVAMDPEAKVIPPTPPTTDADAGASDPTGPVMDGHHTLTAHYFPLGNAYQCYACKNPNAKVHTIRVTRTVAGATLVTPMCAECATAEVDGVLERGDMVVSEDHSFLMVPLLGEIEQKFAEHKAAKDRAATEGDGSEPPAP